MVPIRDIKVGSFYICNNHDIILVQSFEFDVSTHTVSMEAIVDGAFTTIGVIGCRQQLFDMHDYRPLDEVVSIGNGCWRRVPGVAQPGIIFKSSICDCGAHTTYGENCATDYHFKWCKLLKGNK